MVASKSRSFEGSNRLGSFLAPTIRLTFRLKYSRMCGHRAILMNISLGKKGRFPCGDQPGRVKFKKKAEGALLTWILAHCKRSVRISIDVSCELKMPCSTPLM